MRHQPAGRFAGGWILAPKGKLGGENRLIMKESYITGIVEPRATVLAQATVRERAEAVAAA